MANKNIDISIRKPRRTKGTPFYRQRNYYALGLVLASGAAWYLYELWPQTKQLKKSINDGKFEYSSSLQEHRLVMQHSTTDQPVAVALSRLRE